MDTETEKFTTSAVIGSPSPPDRDWRAIVFNRWNSLSQEVLGATSDRSLRLKEIAAECQLLTVVVAWFRHDGNITLTAESLRSNRKSVRDRVSRWRERHPDLVPPLSTRPVHHLRPGAGAPPVGDRSSS